MLSHPCQNVCPSAVKIRRKITLGTRQDTDMPPWSDRTVERCTVSHWERTEQESSWCIHKQSHTAFEQVDIAHAQCPEPPLALVGLQREECCLACHLVFPAKVMIRGFSLTDDLLCESRARNGALGSEPARKKP